MPKTLDSTKITNAKQSLEPCSKLIWSFAILQQADLEEFYQQRSAHLADKVAKKEAELRQLRAEFDKSHLYRCQQLEAHRAKVPNDQEQQAM